MKARMPLWQVVLFAVIAGYIVGLWHQAAQKNYRIRMEQKERSREVK